MHLDVYFLRLVVTFAIGLEEICQQSCLKLHYHYITTSLL